MALKKLKAPESLKIDFCPSPKQYELWKLLQPECPLCGGEVEQMLIGYDANHNPRYKPYCKRCNNQNIPQLVLGGGAAGGGKSFISSVWLVSSCIRFPDIRAVVARKTLKSLKEQGYIDLKYSSGNLYCIAPVKKYEPEQEPAPLPVPVQEESGSPTVKPYLTFLAAFLGAAAGSLLVSLPLALL